MGRTFLNNALKGYNAAIFAYGQTGSGKSYSIIGYGHNRGTFFVIFSFHFKFKYLIFFNSGIVPRICEELFQIIESQKMKGAKTIFEVSLSMLEIYNEVVRDLLNPETFSATSKQKGLKVREHPIKGFYGNIQLLIIKNF